MRQCGNPTHFQSPSSIRWFGYVSNASRHLYSASWHLRVTEQRCSVLLSPDYDDVHVRPTESNSRLRPSTDQRTNRVALPSLVQMTTLPIKRLVMAPQCGSGDQMSVDGETGGCCDRHWRRSGCCCCAGHLPCAIDAAAGQTGNGVRGG